MHTQPQQPSRSVLGYCTADGKRLLRSERKFLPERLAASFIASPHLVGKLGSSQSFPFGAYGAVAGIVLAIHFDPVQDSACAAGAKRSRFRRFRSEPTSHIIMVQREPVAGDAVRTLNQFLYCALVFVSIRTQP